jgi:glycosyltransferase involved in cell wall biosynthesis
VGAIPEIIGDTGFILPEKKMSGLKDIVLKLAEQDLAALRENARKRISTQFHYKQRQRELLSLFGIKDKDR